MTVQLKSVLGLLISKENAWNEEAAGLKKLFFVKSPTKLFSYEKCFSAARRIVILAPFIFPKNGPLPAVLQ